jgi:phosphoribosyl-AMP cyclohydrolase
MTHFGQCKLLLGYVACITINAQQNLERTTRISSLFPVLLLQHVDTGELLMQAFADRAAISETMQTG